MQGFNGVAVLTDQEVIADLVFIPGVVLDERIHKAELCKLPMYDPKGEIVRGINKDIPTKAEPWVGIKS